MEGTGGTFLRVGKEKLKGLLVNRMPRQGWVQSFAQSVSSLVYFFFFEPQKQTKTNLTLDASLGLDVALYMWKMNAICCTFHLLSKMLTISSIFASWQK